MAYLVCPLLQLETNNHSRTRPPLLTIKDIGDAGETAPVRGD